MGLPNVRILIQNGQLGGLLRFAAGVCGLIGTGVAVTGKIALNDPRLVFSLAEAEALGITLADNPVAYRHVKEFYDEAGTGAELYIMLVVNTINQTNMCDITNANGIVKLLNYAQGRIRMWGTFFSPDVGYSLVTTNGVDADVYTAIQKAHATCLAYQAQQMPCRAIIEGREFTGTAASLTDATTMAYNRILPLIAGTTNNKSCSTGLALGRLSKLPVQRKMSRVKDGPLNIAAAYAGATKVEDSTQLGLMHDKGYAVIRTFPGITGYYFSGDQTACPTSDDYHSFARGRIIDKMQVIAYGVYVQELGDEISINADGTLNTGQRKTLEEKIKRQLNLLMVAANELSSCDCTIDPDQDILATNLLNVVVKGVPVGYMDNIDVQLGFDNPNV